MSFRFDTKTIYSILKLRNLYSLKSYPVGPNNWGIFLILPVTTGEGVGPAGEILPVVCMLKNSLLLLTGHACSSMVAEGEGKIFTTPHVCK